MSAPLPSSLSSSSSSSSLSSLSSPSAAASASSSSSLSSSFSSSSSSSSSSSDRPECRIIIYNVAKRNNVGDIIRSAVAFGVKKCLVVGQRKLATFGNQNTTPYISFDHFDKWGECLDSLRKDKFKVVGVEISDRSKSILTHPFDGNTAFVFGNEGSGLNEKTLRDCDELVYIPQYGFGTASLNVCVAASIIMHHFAVWAAYEEVSRNKDNQFKFNVDIGKKVSSFKHGRIKRTHDLADAEKSIPSHESSSSSVSSSSSASISSCSSSSMSSSTSSSTAVSNSNSSLSASNSESSQGKEDSKSSGSFPSKKNKSS
eukprot:TRINITY_DN1170_c0_g2_i1.p1 TRINITY_DN1170_c0_g2~~TRINITY_DN1170_c0_g2_i1.p1  ORF type:complete len:331 (-),score=96.22 TRINITY_DN1170_c0_g2_i1:185-1129(-)